MRTKMKAVWGCGIVLFLVTVPATAQVQYTIYDAKLTGAGEPPAVVTAAFGDFSLTVDEVTLRADYTLRLWNVPASLTNAHIHLGVAAVAGPVIYPLNPPAGVSGDLVIRGTIDLASGLIAQPTRGLVDVRDAMQILAEHPEMLYVNIHTSGNPAGEIRGQLVQRR